MATLVKADGTETEVFPANGKKFTPEELQKLVGGYIELTRTNKPVRDMWVNEEGKLNGSLLNHKATMLYQYGYADSIFGDVLVMPARKTKMKEETK